MLFRQLFDRESCTYTYLLADEQTKEAILIDPVRELLERDMGLLDELGLTLKYTMETHVHADHVTASGLLRQELGSQSVLSSQGGAPCVDIAAEDGQELTFGSHTVTCLATPGHTDGCMSYHVPDLEAVFTGDALLIRGCGRTDFQQGSPQTLYASIHDQLFTLGDDTKVFPGHDYKGRTVSSIGEEKVHNPRAGGGRTVEQFAEIMGNLNLAPPKKIAEAVPANQRCGLPVDVPQVDRSVAWSVVRSREGVPEVNSSWVADRIGRYRLIDVRQPAEYTAELGHIHGSELVPLDALAGAAASWDRAAPVVTVCRSGGRSGTAAQLLESMGFQYVASMAGGMMIWNEEERPAQYIAPVASRPSADA
jgi:sulfur dioxygenase